MKHRMLADWRCLITALLILCSSWDPSLAQSTTHLRINCTFHSPGAVFFFRLVQEVCTRNGITLEHHTPPVGRSLILVNNGIDDGDGPRIEGLSSLYPEILSVPESFSEFIFGAFVKSEIIKVRGWEELAGLNVAYIHGWKIFDQFVTATASVTKVKNATLLFQLLDAGRADAVLITKLAGYEKLRQLNLSGIRFMEPPLAVKPNYLYLNKKHRDLLVPFAESLREMKKDGTYEKFYQEIVITGLLE